MRLRKEELKGVGKAGLDAERNRLVFAESSPELKRDIRVAGGALAQLSRITIRTDLCDQHLYIFNTRPLYDILDAKPNIRSIKLVRSPAPPPSCSQGRLPAQVPNQATYWPTPKAWQLVVGGGGLNLPCSWQGCCASQPRRHSLFLRGPGHQVGGLRCQVGGPRYEVGGPGHQVGGPKYMVGGPGRWFGRPGHKVEGVRGLRSALH